MKNQLLQDAASAAYYDSRAMALASQSLSAPEIEQRLQLLTMRISKISKTFAWLYRLTFFGVATVVFIVMSGQLTTPGTSPAAGNLVSAIFSCMNGALSLLVLRAIEEGIYHFWANKDDGGLLTPIAGTSDCERALYELENGGAQAEQWRDLALSERGQLHRFDIKILATLRRVHLQRIADAARTAAQDLACRKVHGLPVEAAK